MGWGAEGTETEEGIVRRGSNIHIPPPDCGQREYAVNSAAQVDESRSGILCLLLLVLGRVDLFRLVALVLQHQRNGSTVPPLPPSFLAFVCFFPTPLWKDDMKRG